jgi:CRP-like cAMP-binding protein
MAWDNHFLDSLDAGDISALRPHLEEVTLERNALLTEAGERISAVYLPTTSILSVITVMKDGGQVESRTIGRESGFGLLHALGSPLSFERMVVQVGGQLWRLPLEVLRRESEARPSLRRTVVHHAQATLIQSAQATACNSLHGAEQRLCRWLLLTQDRLGSNVVPLTQEHLSIMLGVQRTTVTALASELQARGFISYVRGKITILDRPALERCTCECYGAMQRGAAALLKDLQRNR